MLRLLLFLSFTFHVSYQSPDNTLWVNPAPQTVTYYARVPFWNIGLLAESAPEFLQISAGDILTLRSDHKVVFYKVMEVSHYIAVTPLSPESEFISEETGERFTSLQLGKLIYAEFPPRLVLQTCYNTDKSGRIFITAYPIQVGYDLEAYR